MQGTASSRAKAAAAQPASPTRTKAVKPTTSTPVKGVAKRASIVPANSDKHPSTPPNKDVNGNSHDLSESAKKSTTVTAAEPGLDKDNTIEPVEPRTPSPRPRYVANDQDEGDQPDLDHQSQDDGRNSEVVEEKREEVLEETPRASIIGRVGLAGAREAPRALEDPNTSSVSGQSEPTKAPIANDNVNGDNAIEAEAATAPEIGDKSPIARLHPDDIDASGHVADPEMPRSAPSSDQTTSPARNLFGRIGHPGAKAGVHELESPNPSNSTDGKKDDTPKEMEWHEEELKRDPAKTIVSPDAGKGAFAEKKKV